MRTLKKNKQTIGFKTYLGKTQVVDDDGLNTGEYTLTYSNLYTAKMNISAARGVATQEFFGITTNYSKVAVTDDLSCPMDEESIVWIDAATSGNHNYVVVQKAKSLNSILYALREVKS